MKIVVSLLIVYLCGAYSRKLPPYLEPCHRDDPDIAGCIQKNVEIMRPRFKKGIPEMNIPSFDPLVIPEATLTGGQNFKAKFTNIRIYDADKFVIKKLVFGLSKFVMDLDLVFPHLRILSDYEVDGRILILELHGKGPADGNYTNVEGKMSAHGDYITKNGQKFIKIVDKKIDLNIGKPHFKFDKIFGDNEELNEQTNKVINDNVESLIVELNPVVTEIVGQVVFHIVNKIFDTFNFDTLFPV